MLSPGHWMGEWLAAFLEQNGDDLAEKDAIVLDQIREHLQEPPFLPTPDYRYTVSPEEEA